MRLCDFTRLHHNTHNPSSTICYNATNHPDRSRTIKSITRPPRYTRTWGQWNLSAQTAILNIIKVHGVYHSVLTRGTPTAALCFLCKVTGVRTAIGLLKTGGTRQRYWETAHCMKWFLRYSYERLFLSTKKVDFRRRAVVEVLLCKILYPTSKGITGDVWIYTVCDLQ